MLQGKQADQQGVDGQSRPECPRPGSVERTGHQVEHERQQVDEHAQEADIDGHSVGQDQGLAHGGFLCELDAHGEGASAVVSSDLRDTRSVIGVRAGIAVGR